MKRRTTQKKMQRILARGKRSGEEKGGREEKRSLKRIKQKVMAMINQEFPEPDTEIDLSPFRLS
jgi:hypothetical protein